ncbi:MAG: hypothetical protein ACYCS1_05040 [Gammaproteobacteria bacterium]
MDKLLRHKLNLIARKRIKMHGEWTNQKRGKAIYYKNWEEFRKSNTEITLKLIQFENLFTRSKFIPIKKGKEKGKRREYEKDWRFM